MNGLPANWTETTLGEIAVWGSGGTPNRSIPEYYGGQVPWFKTGELNEGILTNAEEYLTEEGIKNSSAKVFPKGSIMIAMYGATIGKCAILGVDASTNQACAVAQPKNNIEPLYLFHYLRSQKQNFIDKGKGGAQPNISQAVIKGHPIPLPPLPEQKRIVAKLDTLFAHLDQLKSRLQNIPILLKQFRQAVLTQAVTGKLTAKGSELSDLTIEDLTDFIGSGVTPKGGRDNYFKEGIPFIRSMNVYPDGLYLEDLAYITIEMHNEMSRTKIKERDVLLNITGASIGRATYVPIGFGEGNVNQHVCILRCNDRIIPEYLSIYINSNIGQAYIMGTQTGMTRQGLNYSQVRAMPVPIPNTKEQKEIVLKVESLLNVADRIEASYKTLQEKIDPLPQAILNKAFRGELVPQDNNEVPANDLLKSVGEKVDGMARELEEELAIAAEPGVKFKRKKDNASS